MRALAALARAKGVLRHVGRHRAGQRRARATYRRAGATEEAPFVLLNWDLAGDDPA